MVTHFEQLRRGLNAATTAYNDAMGSLQKRVLVAARRFREVNPGAPEIPTIAPLEQTARRFELPGRLALDTVPETSLVGDELER
jgi:DNA recombination protein RmuC